jgi:2-methylisocitrate lyase-like PEP mutase family enzyme
MSAPGVADGLSARFVERAGFPAVYASGGGIARGQAIQDLGMAEAVDRVRTIVDAVAIPIIADADDGFGNAVNVQRAVAAFEQAGVAALHLEDQASPKKCDHLDDKSLVSPQEFAQKIRAARDARRGPDLVLIARTDAIAVDGLEPALNRARLYGEAGADVLFVEAPETEAQIERIATELPGAKLNNIFHGGKTPHITDLPPRGARLPHRHHSLRPAARRDPRDAGGARRIAARRAEPRAGGSHGQLR